MLRRVGVAVVIGVCCVGLAGVQGCSRQPLLVPIEVMLGGNSTFSVLAGVPTTKSFTVTDTNTTQITIGQGNLELDPSVITINRNGGGAKIRAQAQASGTCGEQAEAVFQTCLDLGTDSAACEEEGRAFLASCLAVRSEIEVTVWVTSPVAEQAACASGPGVDTYGPYRVMFNENDEVTGVSGSPTTLARSTVHWLDTTGLRVCIQAIAPFNGEIIIDSITFNVGL